MRDAGSGQVIDVTRTLINGGYQEYKRDNESDPPIERCNGWGSHDWCSNFRLCSNLSEDWSCGDFGVNWGVRCYSGLREACAYDLGGGSECNEPGLPIRSAMRMPA